MTQYPYFPHTGEPDLAEDVVGNLNAILDRLMTVGQKSIIVGGSSSVADTLHTHANVKHANSATKLDNDIIINGVKINIGTPTTIQANPNPHNHKIEGSAGNTVLNHNGTPIRSTQMRDIYSGSARPSASYPVSNPKSGDIYIRVG